MLAGTTRIENVVSSLAKLAQEIAKQSCPFVIKITRIYIFS